MSKLYDTSEFHAHYGHALWRLSADQIPPGWQVLTVDCQAWGFGKGQYVRLGMDCLKEKETFEDCETRIAKRFDCKRNELRLTFTHHFDEL